MMGRAKCGNVPHPVLATLREREHMMRFNKQSPIRQRESRLIAQLAMAARTLKNLQADFAAAGIYLAS